MVALQVGLHLALAALAAGRPAWFAAHRELIHTANLLSHNLAIRHLGEGLARVRHGGSWQPWQARPRTPRARALAGYGRLCDACSPAPARCPGGGPWFRPAVTHGTYDYFHEEHRSSPLRLLVCFLCPWGNWPWAAAGALFLRLSVRWNAVALPLATLLPVSATARGPAMQQLSCGCCKHAVQLWVPAGPPWPLPFRPLLPQLLSGRSVCHRLLAADPSFAPPFETAFAALDTLQ